MFSRPPENSPVRASQTGLPVAGEVPPTSLSWRTGGGAPAVAKADGRQAGADEHDVPSAGGYSAQSRVREGIARQQWGAWVLAGAAVALALALVPRGDELLLIHVRNRNIREARDVLADRAREGATTVSSVVAHGELFLLEGRVDEALAELERFVETHPDNVAAWQRLARLYQHAQRLEDETRALSAGYRLQPSDELARRLAAFSLWTGDEAREASLLFDLVSHGTATGEEFARSARLEAALGRPARAIAVLERGLRAGPTALGYADVEFYVGLLVEQGRTSELASRLQQAALVREEPEVLEQLSASLRSWGAADAAVHLYPAPGHGMAMPAAILAGRARAAVGTSVASTVLNEFVTADGVAPLSGDAVPAVLDLALSEGRYDVALRLLTRPDRVAAPAHVASVVTHAVSHGARAQAQALIAQIGDDALTDWPLVALELAIERNDLTRAATWIERIDARRETTAEEHVAVAQVQSRLGHRDAGYARLRAVVLAAGGPVWAYADLAALASAMGQEEDAIAALAGSRGQVLVPERRRAWANLVMRSGRLSVVDAWLRDGDVGASDADALRDIAHRAVEQNVGRLAVEAASRLWSLTGTAEDALLLGQGLLSEGRALDAVAPLRRAAGTIAGARVAYDNALFQAQLSGDAVSTELRSAFSARLRESDIGAEHRQMLVEGLWLVGERASLFEEVDVLASSALDRWLTPLVEAAEAAQQRDRAAARIASADGGLASLDASRRADRVRALLALEASDDVVLVELRRLAYEQGESWVYAYDERLSRSGRVDERVDLWLARGLADEAPEAERRAAAAKLVELGASSAGARVLEHLSQRARPDDADVVQLLALWGPQASSAQVGWLVGRLSEAAIDDKAAWLRHLLTVGGGRAAIEALPQLPIAAPPALIEGWLDAHRGTSETQFRAALEAVMTRPEAATSSLRHAARLALAENVQDAAEGAYLRLHAAEPHDDEALRWLGTLAFYRHDFIAARTYLTRYVEGGGDEAEPLFQLGELARDARQADDAQGYYALARARLDAMDASTRNGALLANVLVRLGDRHAARVAFDEVLRATPDNDHVRADFVVALLEWGASNDAWRVLSESEQRLVAGGSDTSGAKRLELLRVQWLSAAGRYREALERLDRLARQRPLDPDVRLARASFDADRGRTAEAERQFERVAADEPQRSDVAAVVREWGWRQAPRASVQYESRNIGRVWTASGTSVAAEARRGRSAVSVQGERLFVRAPAVLRADGRTAPLAAELTRWDASLTSRLAVGTTLATSVFGTATSAGAGVTLRHHDLRGAFALAVERGRPFWEFAETAADDGRRDKVGVQRDWRFGADTAAWFVADWNTYRLASGPAAASVAMTLGAVRTIRRRAPSVALQYGLDKEHRVSAQQVAVDNGRTFTPIPLSSREVHLVGAIARVPVRRRWDIDATVGYTLDRLGGRGSFVTGHLTPRPSQRAGIEAWGEWRLYTLTTTQRAWRSGMRLVVRF